MAELADRNEEYYIAFAAIRRMIDTTGHGQYVPDAVLQQGVQMAVDALRQYWDGVQAKADADAESEHKSKKSKVKLAESGDSD